MKPTEMLNKITTLLGAKIELEEAKLENGTVLEADSFANGESVFIVTEDEKVPLPIGEYQMEDGKTLIISEEGIIEEIKSGDEKSEEVIEEDLEHQVNTGSDPRDLEAEKESDKKVEAPVKKSKKDLAEDDAPEEEKESTELDDIVEKVVEAIAPIINEVKEELSYVKEELGKMKEEELSRKEVEEKVKEDLSTQPGANPLKHNPESETSKSLKLLSKNKTGVSTMDIVLQRMANFKHNK
tara:strand:+ start:101 stop:820 length:720 start_codon:yes stop_codon:yes gene_type:complete